MRLIDANKLVDAIVEVRNKIPLYAPCATYELLDEKPFAAGQNQRGGIRKALRCVADAPTVDAVPVVHGRWIMDYDCGSIVLQCSICDEQYWIADESEKKPNYCPNCGSRMDGNINE